MQFLRRTPAHRNTLGENIAAKHALSIMAPRKYGRMLFVASIAGKDGNPDMAGYSASKAGLIGLRGPRGLLTGAARLLWVANTRNGRDSQLRADLYQRRVLQLCKRSLAALAASNSAVP